MSIPETVKERKGLLIICVLVIIAVSSFMLGRFSVENPERDISVYLPDGDQVAASALSNLSGGQQTQAVEESFVIASKRGSKYHYPWCSGAKTISEENKIIFQTNVAARAAGYLPAGNCKGLE